jgi:hypothetical protein
VKKGQQHLLIAKSAYSFWQSKDALDDHALSNAGMYKRISLISFELILNFGLFDLILSLVENFN